MNITEGRGEGSKNLDTENRMCRSPVADMGHVLQGQCGRTTGGSEEMLSCVPGP